MRGAWPGVLLLPLACGPEGLSPAALDAVCGGAEPVRLLALAPGEVLFEAVLQVGERTIFATVEHAPVTDDTKFPAVTRAGLWSTGPCGESPVRLDADVAYAFVSAHDPDLLLARSADERAILVVDPLGGPSHVLFAEVGTPRGWATRGLIATRPVDESADAAYLFPWPEDPRTQAATPMLLIDGVPTLDASWSAPRTLDVTAEVLRVRDIRGDLLRLDLPDGAPVREQAGVWDFSVSPDGRWLVWQDLKPIETTLPEAPAGAVSLRDTTSGEEVLLADTALVGQAAMWNAYARGLLTLDMGPEGAAPQRVYTLATGTYVELPMERALDRVLDDGRWLLRVLGGWKSPVVFDPNTLEERALFHDSATVVWRGDEGIELVDLPPCCGTNLPVFAQGSLWSAPFDGLPRELAAEATRFGLRLDDGRRVTTLEVGNDTLGQLVLLDPDARTTTRIDDRVFAVVGAQPSRVHDGAILYSVDDGERSGVWIARPGA